jgi:hypothetical protein
VNGRGHRTMIGGKYLSAVLCEPKLGPEQTLRRSCAEADNELRTNGGNLCFQPWAAGHYFQRVRLLMQPDLSARLPLEMLNSIGDVHLTPVDPRRLEAFIQQVTSRPDKRLPLLIFAIAGLFPHQENSGMGAAFAKDDLRGFPVEVASTTLAGCFP